MNIFYSVQKSRGFFFIHIWSPNDKMCCVKICVAKLLIRQGPDRHQAGAEILLFEDLKTFSNHCRLLAASLTNASDFSLE